MRTQLDQFCRHFDTTVRPLLAPLGTALEALQQADPATAASSLASELGELKLQIEALVEKVAGQQAYVLIFGPLKSGKSTLMNAIAGSYVSEVSSLPAYPCLVFVRHGVDRRYSVADYAGEAATFEDAADLQRRIEESHHELAATMRATEESGEVFDPQTHMPSAIRRIDVRVPTRRLGETGAVLVDTPGLYTRMRFGYDRMTRDFRNAAATAIFVVKSDNLFLEQVFTEFHQLLELFSRIFLVVNIDSTKRDVRPDGKLVPSMEQHSPQRILEAFRKLAMTAPLEQAAAEGRLRLYPVDLMHAASAALDGDGKERGMPESFRRFRTELMDYLASADYLTAFLGDSMQRAHALVGEVLQLTEGEDIEELRAAVADIESRMHACRDDLDSIRECIGLDWGPVFQRFREELDKEIQRAGRDHAARTARAMGAAVDTWFLSSHSLKTLTDREWGPLVQDFQDATEHTARSFFEHALARGATSLEIDPNVAAFLHSLGIDLVAIRREVLHDLPAPEPVHGGRPLLDHSAIPIRRSMLDRVTMRPEDRVRERLLGPADDPDQKITARAKRSRLGEPAKFYIRQELMQFRKELFPGLTDAVIHRYGEQLQRATIERVCTALEALEPGLREAEGELAREAARLRQQLEPLELLQADAGLVEQKLHALSTQYAAASASLAEPSATVVIEPAPRQKSGQRAARSRDERKV